MLLLELDPHDRLMGRATAPLSLEPSAPYVSSATHVGILAICHLYVDETKHCQWLCAARK